MVSILARRLATGAATLLLITMLVFALMRVAAGDPLSESMDAEGLRRPSPAAIAELRRLYHFDQPVHRQYLMWLRGALSGDLGRSIHDRRAVTERIRERLGITLALNVLALGLMIAVAVPLGALAALRPGSWLDISAASGTYLLYALPAFWAALLLQIVVSVGLGWLPLYGLVSAHHDALPWLGRMLDRAAHLVLPVACLSYGGIAYLSRFVRATLLDNQAFASARAARARGLSQWTVLRTHGFRLAAVPLLTLAGLLLPGLVAGSVIVESVFAIPGLGRLFVDAAYQRDLPVLLGLTLISGAATLAGVIGADVAYVWADPRRRRG